jgi:putative ABC transport system permease protein
MILVGGPWQAPGAEPQGADVTMVSPGLPAALGLGLLRGRAFTAADRPGATRVAAVNETAARAFFGAADPIGQTLRISQAVPAEPPFTVVAVVRDTPTAGVGADVRPQVFLPLAQAVAEIRGVTRSVSVVLRTSVKPASLAGTLRGAVWELDRNLAVSGVETMEGVVAAALRPQRFQALLLAVFAAVAVVLASVGLYGLLAHLVGQTRRDLGVRIAMGASPRRLLGTVLGHGVALAGLGLAAGTVATLAVGPLVAAQLYGVTPHDAASLGATVAVMLAVSLAAAVVPALRAARVDPIDALRAE